MLFLCTFVHRSPLSPNIHPLHSYLFHSPFLFATSNVVLLCFSFFLTTRGYHHMHLLMFVLKTHMNMVSWVQLTQHTSLESRAFAARMCLLFILKHSVKHGIFFYCQPLMKVSTVSACSTELQSKISVTSSTSYQVLAPDARTMHFCVCALWIM